MGNQSTRNGYTYLVVARENGGGRFMAPRQSRAADPASAIAELVQDDLMSDRESWEDVKNFIVFDLDTGEDLRKTTVTETPEPITTVTYERK
jgi:hypothetical protein